MTVEKSKIKRVLYISEKAGFFGGVERYIYDTASVLKQAGWEVCMMFNEEALELEKFLDIFEKSFKTDEIDKLIAEEDFDLAVIFKVSDPALVTKLRLAFNTSVCVSDHDYYCLRHHKYFPIGRINCPLPSNLLYCSICNLGRGKMFKFASLLNEIRKCRSFIVLSEFMRNNLLKNNFSKDDIFKIYPVCKLPETSDSPASRSKVPVIMYAGQLIRGKGVDLLLYALAKIQKKYKALIVGDGKDMEFLKELAAKLGINEKVEFTGWQNEISASWSKADIAVFPSRWQEPFGLTGIEAFAHKIPVVGFDVGGVSEWLHSGENGLAVPPRDVTAFSVELEYLLNTPDTAEKMGEAGYKFVAENFTPAKFASAMDAMLKKTRRKNV